MIERSRGARFLRESAQLVLGVRARRKQLDGDAAVELQIARREDATHSAASELAFDGITITDVGKIRTRAFASKRVARRQALAGDGLHRRPTCSGRRLRSNAAGRRGCWWWSMPAPGIAPVFSRLSSLQYRSPCFGVRAAEHTSGAARVAPPPTEIAVLVSMARVQKHTVHRTLLCIAEGAVV